MPGDDVTAAVSRWAATPDPRLRGVEWVTREQAASILGVPVRRLAERRDEWGLAHLVQGRSVLYALDDVRRVAESLPRPGQVGRYVEAAEFERLTADARAGAAVRAWAERAARLGVPLPAALSGAEMSGYRKAAQDALTIAGGRRGLELRGGRRG